MSDQDQEGKPLGEGMSNPGQEGQTLKKKKLGELSAEEKRELFQQLAEKLEPMGKLTENIGSMGIGIGKLVENLGVNKLAENLGPMATLLDRIGKTITTSLGESISKFNETLSPVMEYMEAHREAIDLQDKWPEITGWSLDELDELSLKEAVELVEKCLKEGPQPRPKIAEGGSFATVRVDTVRSVIKQAEAAKAIAEQVEAAKAIMEAYSKLPAFHTIHQGKASNTLARMKTKITGPAQLNIYGDAEIRDKNFKLFIAKYRELAAGVRPTAMLLLDTLVITATEKGQRESLVKLPLKNYMEMRGLKDKDSARQQVEEDLEALYNISISFTDKERDPETRKYKPKNYLDIRICDAKGIIRGVINFNFGGAFFSLLNSYPVMPYPKEILTFNLKHNPHSPRLLRRVTEHVNMNYFKKNRDIISVKALLEACPELPKYKDLGKAQQPKKRIIDPFERDLDAIKSFKWHYCGKNGSPADQPATYAEFEKALIKITWENYPARLPKTTQARGKRSKKNEG